MKNIDRYALRKIRELVDAEYAIRPDAYEIDRTAFEAVTHALFGGEPTEETLKNREWEQNRQEALDSLAQLWYGKDFDKLSDDERTTLIAWWEGTNE